MYYGHGSWIAVVVFAGLFIVRALSSSRRRGGPTTRSPFVDRGRQNPPPAPTSHDTDRTGVAPGWFADPFLRHDQRYWSGTAWSEHVSDNGVPSSDPPPVRSNPPADH